jgi:hypothetical protein
LAAHTIELFAFPAGVRQGFAGLDPRRLTQ